MSKLFKSEAFRSVVVIFLLAVILGGLLAVLSDVLYVSPSDRATRAIKKIYNAQMDYEIELDIDVNDAQVADEYEFGQINKRYKIAGKDSNHYDLLFQAVGFNGYKGGTITVWVKVGVNTETNTYSIDKVLLESYDKQTLMSKLSDSYYSNFELTDVTTAYKNNELFTTDTTAPNANPVSGATYSANAGNNAVNCVITYIGRLGLGG